MINIDNNIANSDWIKHATWDLPTNVKGFLNVIGGVDKWERFKTLPSYRPMPESLRNDVDAYVRAHEAHKVINKYNPDQPRDELGRFGEMGTPQERLDRFNSETYAKGQGVVLKGKELRAKELEKMQQMVVHHPMSRAGSTSDFAFEDPETLFNQMKAEKELYNNFDMRVLGSGFVYSNGPIQIQATSDRYLKDGGLDAIVEQVERLQETNPVSALDIRIGDRGMGNKSFGEAVRGGSTMWLSAGKLMNDKAVNEIDPFGYGASGWFMPVRTESTGVQATVTHEWGHLIDRDPAARSAFFTNNAELISNNISRYGATNSQEGFAELFTEYALSNGQTTNPAAQAAAKEFKW